MNSVLNSSAVLQRNNNQLFSEVDDEIIMLNLSTEEYIYLNKIGSIIWQLLENPQKYSNLISYLTEVYDINFDNCKEETEPFILELISCGLVVIA